MDQLRRVLARIKRLETTFDRLMPRKGRAPTRNPMFELLEEDIRALAKPRRKKPATRR